MAKLKAVTIGSKSHLIYISQGYRTHRTVENIAFLEPPAPTATEPAKYPVFGPEVIPCPDCEDEDICTNCGRAANLYPVMSEEGDCYDPK